MVDTVILFHHQIGSQFDRCYIHEERVNAQVVTFVQNESFPKLLQAERTSHSQGCYKPFERVINNVVTWQPNESFRLLLQDTGTSQGLSCYKKDERVKI